MIFIILTILIPIILLFIFEGNWPKKVFKWLFEDTTQPMRKGENFAESVVHAIGGVPNIIWMLPYIVIIVVIIAIATS